MSANALALWLFIGTIPGGALGTFSFLEGSSFLDYRLWLHFVRSTLGIRGAIADLPDPNGSG
jgi:hypothetical protein